VTVPPPSPEPEDLQLPERVQPIREAEKLITGDRNNAYGEPHQDFDRTARFWSIYLEHKLKPDVRLDPHDVALMMDLLKTSRLVWSPGRYDSWVDKIGYAACGWECAVLEARPDVRPTGKNGARS